MSHAKTRAGAYPRYEICERQTPSPRLSGERVGVRGFEMKMFIPPHPGPLLPRGRRGRKRPPVYQATHRMRQPWRRTGCLRPVVVNELRRQRRGAYESQRRQTHRHPARHQPPRPHHQRRRNRSHVLRHQRPDHADHQTLTARYFPQQFLNFFPLLHGHGSLRPTFGPIRTGRAFSTASAAWLTMSLAFPFPSGAAAGALPPNALVF